METARKRLQLIFACILLAAPMAVGGWKLGVWVYSTDFGAVPLWFLLMASFSVIAGFGFGRFAIPSSAAFSLALTSSLAYRADPHVSTTKTHVIGIVVFMYLVAAGFIATTALIQRQRRKVGRRSS